jgi:transposase
MDSGGVPITYHLYPGNTNDCLTLLPILKNAKEKYHIGRTIVVADKGLNTSDNIAALILEGHGYLFSQTVRGADAKLKEWVLDESGYNGTDTFKVKSSQSDKTVYIKDPANKTVKVKVPIKQVAYWSADYAARARHEREAVLAKSKKLVRDSATYEHAKSYGAARYIKETVVETKTGEIKKTILEIDNDQIAKDERFDGYYCIITSETDLSDKDIIDTYAGLWQIEETFKVTKEELETRPVYVWTRPHIEAHFLSCYVALVVLRLIQSDTNFEYSVAKIIDAIRGIVGSHMKQNYYLFSYRTHLTDHLGKLIGQNLAKQVLSKGDIKKIFATTKKT